MTTILPEVSVVVCCYNQGKYLERCLRSLYHQAHIDKSDFEVIVVNDGSTDITPLVLDDLKQLENLRILNHTTNRGLPSSCNAGIRASHGRFIVRVDSDDYVGREFLYLGRLFLNKNKKYQGVATDYITVDDNENQIDHRNCLEHQIACGVFFRKECLIELGLYNEEFKMREGHELRQRFDQKFLMGRLEFPLYKYRQHNGNRTKDTASLSAFDKKLTEK